MHKPLCKVYPVSNYVHLTIARSRQVYMKLVVEALLVICLFYLGSVLILMDIRKPFRSSTCPAEPFQLIPAQLSSLQRVRTSCGV